MVVQSPLKEKKEKKDVKNQAPFARTAVTWKEILLQLLTGKSNLKQAYSIWFYVKISDNGTMVFVSLSPVLQVFNSVALSQII